MNKKSSSINLSRRDFLKIAGGAAFVAAGAGFMPQALRRVLRPEAVAQAQVEPRPVLCRHGRLDLPAAHTGDSALPS